MSIEELERRASKSRLAFLTGEILEILKEKQQQENPLDQNERAFILDLKKFIDAIIST